MFTLDIHNTNKKILMSKKIFNYPFNKALIHQIVESYLTNARSGSRSQKNRSEVSGSSRKPWKQKGTGRARAGNIRSPIWRSGGKTFAAKPKIYNKKINKKMYQGAIKSILSELIRQNRLIIIDKMLTLNTIKTKELIKQLKNLSLPTQEVVIFSEELKKHENTRNLLLSSQNLYKVTIHNLYDINPANLISHKKTIITPIIVHKLQEWLK